MLTKNSYCSFCGAPFVSNQPWPRVCAVCGNTTYRNPLPVVVVLLPVDDGLLVVRRAVAPQIGMLALPGGYVNDGETWQVAGARELFEETGVQIDPAELQVFSVESAPDSTILIFATARPHTSVDLPLFELNVEASERLVIGEPTELAFPLHTKTVAAFFARPAPRL